MISQEQEYLQNLRIYYRYLFPHKLLTQWLSYSSNPVNSQLHLRQFSYTLKEDQQEIYVRYRIVKDAQDLLNQLIKDSQTPAKIDIGAFFQHQPQKGRPNKPTKKQLVIDIDINDYDQVRTCCQGKKCCKRCWKFLAIALNLLKISFQQDFGFKNFLCVFSGRRGVHMWVCDQRALLLQVPQRRAVISYLKLISGNQTASSQLCQNTLKQQKTQQKNKAKQTVKKYLIQKRVHPMVARAIQYLKPHFFQLCIKDQKILQSQKCVALIFKIIMARSKNLYQKVRQRWKIKPEWKSLQQQVQKYQRQGNTFKKITFVQQEIILTFLYPRLDIQVSVQMHHLLKSPFSVHPSTQKVSVPISMEGLFDFDPQTSVDLKTLISEIERRDDLVNQNPKIAKQSSLRQAVEILQVHSNKCAQEGTLKAMNIQF